MQKRWNIVLRIKKKKIKKIITLDTRSVNLATTSSTDLKIISLNSILWNIKVFNRIFKFQGFKKIEKINIKRGFEKSYINKKFARLKFLNFNNLNKVNNEFFLYNLAIPKKLRIKFLLKNLQIPLKIQDEKKISFCQMKKIKRNMEKTYKYKKSSNKFENFLNASIPDAFPRIYLDKFKQVESISKNLNWPKKPKKILSSYAHFDDEVFKNYKSNLKNTKYYIFQHGAAGMYNEHVSQFFEEKLSDRYFTWGWKNNNKTFPLFVTSSFNNNKKSLNLSSKKIKILLSIYQFPLFPQRSSYGYTKDLSRNTFYTNYLISFLAGLNKDLIKNVFIKCQYLYKPCLQEAQIKKNFKKIKFISTLKKSHQISQDFHLTVETFLSTGFFESMTLNRPVILLFNKNLTNINKRFLFWVKKLKKDKICFESLKEANQFLNNKSVNLKKWWFGKNLQKTRIDFCKLYARNPLEYENTFEKKIFN